jgi:hypothetical protein
MSPLLGEGGLQTLTLSSLVLWPSAQSEAGVLRIEQAVKFGGFSCLPLLFDEFHRTALEALLLGLSSDLRVEPTVGIEPTTGGLQNRCSTAELCWHSEGRDSTRPLGFGKWISVEEKRTSRFEH